MKRFFIMFLNAVMLLCSLMPAVTAESGGIIVTLDPGHGSSSTGTDAAVAFGGENEMVYNLKIAEYCKERLEKYDGITVYLTKKTLASTPSLEDRVKTAVRKKSDSIVSIHNNYSGKASVSGTQIYIPNGNYRADMAKNSLNLANRIMSRLNKDAGTRKCDSPYYTNHDTYKYPDGSVADYWGIVRNAKQLGLNAGIIVECVFCSNESDVKNFLLKDEKLMALGYAIADGIADYYKLSLAEETVPETTAATTEAPATAVAEETENKETAPATTISETDTEPVQPDNGKKVPVWVIVLISVCATSLAIVGIFKGIKSGKPSTGKEAPTDTET